MTAGELAERLASVPAHHQVVFAIDPEGNAFRTVVDTETAHVRAADRHGTCEVLPPEEGAAQPDNALVLWP